jgi:UDP-glucose 4-epimerase
LIEAGYKVVIVDNGYNSSGEEVIRRIELLSGTKPAFYSVDITDEAALDKVFAENPDIDNVIHFAALKVLMSSTHGCKNIVLMCTRLLANRARYLWITIALMSTEVCVCCEPWRRTT